MSTLTIKKNPSLNDFFAAAEYAYRETPQFVSILNTDIKRLLDKKNPLFAKHGSGDYYVAYRSGQPVGRIVAHIHQESNRKFNTDTGYFGYFDCINDLEVASQLLQKAEAQHKQSGMRKISGNFNLTAMQQIGVVTDQFQNDPYTDQVYSPDYLPTLLERNGYQKEFPMRTFEIDLTQTKPEDLKSAKTESIFNNPDYSFEKVIRKNFSTSLESVREVLNDGFQNNPMFVPLTSEEFLYQAKDMMWILDPEISALLTYNKRAVGTIVCIPDLNQFFRATRSKLSWRTPLAFINHKLTRDRAVIIFYSVAQEFHGRGINSAMLFKVISALKARGYQKLGITWISEQNQASLRQVEKMGAKTLHKLHLFSKDLV
ncbi:MAG: GNAT family N-acetyltransferase [Halobacteriovoraceae bacterium]|nr:GNAT family N-acetyltransferase [Halobacteriovoraceae bacterium]|tara:strand:+ start:11952 stop:13067 length:1116 start_codon:yes stop_codon:yes gene_type:complete